MLRFTNSRIVLTAHINSQLVRINSPIISPLSHIALSFHIIDNTGMASTPLSK